MEIKLKCEKEVNILIEGIYLSEENKKMYSYIQEGNITVIPSTDGKKPHKILVGLGKEENITYNKIRDIAAKSVKMIGTLEGENIVINFPIAKTKDKKDFCIAVTEGILLTDFTFDKYKTDKKIKKERIFYLEMADEETRCAIEQACVVADAINKIRPLVLEPCNTLYPETFAEWIEKAGVEYGFETEIFDDKEIEKRNLRALLSVGKGSQNKPYMIIMRYNGNADGETIGLIGKGITCDTGGYCLKSRDSLPYIKGDMAGAANIIGIMCAVAKNKLPVNVVGIVPSAENRISDSSYMCGDVVNSFLGKTIEIMDTDCEGRLILADALAYAVQCEKVDKLIDMATLTGLAGSMFGSLYTPLFGSDKDFTEKFMNAAKKTGEDFWQMPLDDRYKSYLQSGIADLSNKAGAGTITAAMFLKEFTQEKPWIHLDIAATAIQYPTVYSYAENVPSGIGIRTIYELLGGYTK